MDKHAKTEQDLSEEQLQQITGGCGDCENNKRTLNEHQERADLFSWHAEAAQGKGNRQKLEDYVALKQFHSDEAKRFEKQIDTRLGTPGHPPVPGPAFKGSLDYRG